MASSTRFMTPPAASPPPEPVTPDSGLRNRGIPRSEQGGDASPTSSTISNLSRILEPSRPLYRPIPSAPQSAFGTPRKVTIRADPALVTCFDPADRELYDLWAPRQ